MSKKKDADKLGKVTRISAIIAAVLVIFPCLAIAVFGVMDIAQIFPLLGEPRYYQVHFSSGSQTLLNKRYLRGEILDKVEKPTNVDGDFIGWDINEDSIPDILPNRVYMSINAKAVWVIEKVSESVESEESNG